MKFKDSAINTDTIPQKGELESVGADFGDMSAASSSEQEALGAADEEVNALKKSLGGDFVLEDTLVFDEPQAGGKAGASVGATESASDGGFSIALVSSVNYDTATLIEKLSKDKRIEKAEPNYYVTTNSYDDYSLNDEYSSYLYHVNSPMAKNTGGDSVSDRGIDPETALSVNASSGWSKLSGDEEEAVVAVVDSGVLYTHEDLKDIMWVNPGNIGLKGTHGYNFAYKNDDPIDDVGHGTHCAGMIAAQANNGIGVAGIASQANIKIMALKTFGGGGFGVTTAYANYGAFNYIHKAVLGGVNVVAVNNSWGGTSYATVFDDLIDMLGEDGVVSLIAAGNDGVDNDRSMYQPSNSESDYAVSVGAANMKGNAALFSNYGKASVDVFAPGVNILSTVSYKSYFPSIYDSKQLNDTTEYYGEFNAGTKVTGGTVTPSTGAKAGEDIKAFGSLQFAKQSLYENSESNVYGDDDYGSDDEESDKDGEEDEEVEEYGDEGEEQEDDDEEEEEEPVVLPEAELRLSVVKGEHFVSDNPYRLKITLKNANPGESYFIYFPYEKNPLTTGDDNTYFSFNAEAVASECTADAIIHCGEVCKDENGRLTLTDALGYGNGLDLVYTPKANEGIQRHAVNPGTEGTKYLLSAEEAEGKQVGLGICIKGEWMDEKTNDFSLYLDSIGVSKPNAGIDPDSSYEVMSGTSMACPSATGVCALVASLNPRRKGESGSDYAKRIRTELFAIVRQTAAFGDKCSTGGYLDLSLLNADTPAITDAVCDVENETITLYGENLYEGVVKFKSLSEGGDYKNLPDEMSVETLADGKTIIISNAKSLFSTYTAFAVTSPEGKRGVGKFFLVKGQNRLEEVSSYTKPQSQKLETPYLVTDADGKKLYGYYSQTGTVSSFDGTQFNAFNRSDLNNALLEYLVSIGLDRYDVYNGFKTTLLPSQTPVIENGVIYTLAFIDPPEDFLDDEEAGESSWMGTALCLCSFDLNDENPRWSVQRTKDLPEDFVHSDFQMISCFCNGKIYVLPLLTTDSIWTEDDLMMYSLSPDTGEWTEEAHLPIVAGGFDVAAYDGKLYAVFGFIPDYSIPVEQRILKSVWCFDGEKWERKSDIDLVGRITNKYDKQSRLEAIAKVKNGLVFINTSVDGGGNVFLYDPDTEEIKPMYYTESGSLSDSYGVNHSCAVTRDGIYYIHQTEDEYNRGWKLCLLPESSGAYESPFKEVILGDADGDGSVTISDATMIQKYLAEFDMPENFVLKACDADGDGRVTINDVTAIQKYLAEMDAPEGIGKPI